MRYPPTLGFLSSAFFILSLASPLTAQITFQRTYGGEERDLGYSAAQTTDGGYIITGWTKSYGNLATLYLVKTDAFGDTMWTRTYGGRHEDAGESVQQTTDGGYIITGWTESFGGEGYCVWLLKTDASGDTIWTRTWGDTEDDWGYSVAQTADGGYVIAGYTNADAWLIKTDASGGTIWTRTYGGNNDDDCGYSVAQTVDGGYIVTGYTCSYGPGDADAWLIKTDANGDTMWTRAYGGESWDQGHSVTQTTDGGYVIAGWTLSFGAGESDVYLVKTDADGDTMWTRTWGGADRDQGFSVAQTTDGGYVIAGETKSYGAGDHDFWLIKTDASGDTMWTRTHGGTSGDYGYSVAQTADGGYVMTGRTHSFGYGYDVWLVKTDSAGNVAAIAEPRPPIAHKHIKATIVRGVLEISSQLTAGSSRPGIGLYDIDGRRVAVLHSGPNDVRHLAPGVYFVREKGSRIQGFEGSSRKVILTH